MGAPAAKSTRTSRLPGLRCPGCRIPLQMDRDPHGIIWVCDRCGGAAANLAVLRRRLKGGLVTAFWRRVLAGSTPSGRSCPSCRASMMGFRTPVNHHEIGLDLCKKCQVVWFDRGELEAFPKAPDPDRDIPPEVRQQMAMFKVQQDALENEGARAQNWADMIAAVLWLILRLLSRA